MKDTRLSSTRAWRCSCAPIRGCTRAEPIMTSELVLQVLCGPWVCEDVVQKRRTLLLRHVGVCSSVTTATSTSMATPPSSVRTAARISRVHVIPESLLVFSRMLLNTWVILTRTIHILTNLPGTRPVKTPKITARLPSRCATWEKMCRRYETS